MRRVVVTGLGMVSPLGRGVEYNWKSILDGKSGIRKIEGVDLKDIPVEIAGQVPFGEGENDFNPDTVMAPKDQKKVDKFILYGLAAGSDAVEDSGWKPEADEDQFRSGVMMGSGIGGLQHIYENSIAFNENGIKKISPFFIPSCLINMVSGNLSIKYRVFIINAVLEPKKTDYYYFCNNLKTGETFYAKTLDEHEENLVKAGLAKKK